MVIFFSSLKKKDTFPPGESVHFQEGIDAVAAIDEPGKMDSGGGLALNKLRIGRLASPMAVIVTPLWVPPPF